VVCPRSNSGFDDAGTKKGSFANDVQKIQAKPNRMDGCTYVEKLTGPEPRSKNSHIKLVFFSILSLYIQPALQFIIQKNLGADIFFFCRLQKRTVAFIASVFKSLACLTLPVLAESEHTKIVSCQMLR